MQLNSATNHLSIFLIVTVANFAFSLFQKMNDELVTVLSCLIGTIASVLWHFDFIKENKKLGIVLVIVSFYFPIIALQGLVLWNEKPIPFQNLVAGLFGLVVFEMIRIFMDNQNKWFTQILEVIVKSVKVGITSTINKVFGVKNDE